MSDESTQTPPAGQPVFRVEKLYLKDLSFENPNAPESFRDPGEPRTEYQLESNATQKGPEHFEATLHITVKVLVGEVTLFLVDVTYAGLFLMRNIPREHIAPMLGIECPNIIFPFARQVVASLVTEGGYTPVVLDPINFMALYQQQLQQRQQEA
ncbi:Protein-export protein SecB [Candidatus Magnetaquicoccaceae bacterium FCR-1]|uniref:Protein-export protein SecB n=1 Tax=Candidatus Magnetaquiglobus chichijimensis TaxID=3141448 RepID=A0ABQ0CD38_9PROT